MKYVLPDLFGNIMTTGSPLKALGKLENVIIPVDSYIDPQALVTLTLDHVWLPQQIIVPS